MIKINYILDHSQPVDETELLGDIYIVDDDNRSISQKDTFIDSWFIGLSEGLQLIKYLEKCSIEIPEEPSPLSFDRSARTIEYENQVIFVNNFESMETHLYHVIENLLLEINSKETDGTIAILRKSLEQYHLQKGG